MKILAIETSCDETAVAVVAPIRQGYGRVKVLSNIVASSEEMHQKTGGIVPEVAAREQIRSIIPVIGQAVKNARLKIKNLDAVAVTVGPGLVGSLLVGVETARALAYAWEKPIIPVNHLIAHLYANWVNDVPEFPAVGLVVSGGHTDLVLMQDHGKLKLLGRTRDDAAGECFDKSARILGLPYPGGPAIAAEAAQLIVKNEKLKIKLPRPLMQEKTYDFSFSGLKTALLRQSADQGKPAELAYELQEAIVEVLVSKVMRAVDEFRPKSILIGGGVAANFRLRQKLQFSISNFQFPINLHIPPPNLCTDNGVSIGVAAYYNYTPVSWQEVKVDPELEIV